MPTWTGLFSYCINLHWQATRKPEKNGKADIVKVLKYKTLIIQIA